MSDATIIWYVIPISGLTQEIIDASTQTSIFSARKTVDGSEVLLSFSISDIPLSLYESFNPIEHDSVYDELIEDKWNPTGS